MSRHLDCSGPTTYQRAETDQDFEQVYRLNHDIFCLEVGQYDAKPAGRLIDKFHHKNIYYLALRQGELVGMVAVHDEPPFSIANRLADPAALGRRCPRPLEVRLLALRPSVRRGSLLFGLLWRVYDHAQRHGHSHLLISGVGERVSMYERLGFESLGPPVVAGSAEFVPMVLEVGALPPTLQRMAHRYRSHQVRPARPDPIISLLPGPVEVKRSVAGAFQAPPVWHRAPRFIELYEGVRSRLGTLVGGRAVGFSLVAARWPTT